jgi:hypothetical protein
MILVKKIKNKIYSFQLFIGRVIEKVAIGKYGDRLKRWYYIKYVYPRWDHEQKLYEDIQFASNMKWYDDWVKTQYHIPWYLAIKVWIQTKIFKSRIQINVSKLRLKKPEESK